MKKRPISIAKGTINIKNLLDLLHAFEDLEKAIKQFKQKRQQCIPFYVSIAFVSTISTYIFFIDRNALYICI